MAPSSVARPGRRLALLGQLAVAATFVAMAVWTWGTWPDVLVDFGRELYVPWRLSEGARLQRDIAWFSGPLSQELNGYLFRLAGVSLATLVWFNLGLLAVFTALWWSLLARLAGSLAASVACCVLPCVFGFAQLVGISNYNFITPYSHEVTHGLFLGTAALWVLVRWDAGPGLRQPLLAGLLLGLCFLTKAEVFLASALACAVYLGLALGAERERRPAPRRVVLAVLAAAALPLLLAVLGSLGPLGARGALRSVFGAWIHVLSGGAGQLDFYRWGMGIDQPLTRLAELFAWALRWLLVLAPCAWLATRLRPGRELAHACTAAALFFGAGVVAASHGRADWLAALRPLPLFVLALGAAAWLLLRRSARDGRQVELQRRARLGVALCVLAFVLLFKMILNARVQHYGFALALPGTLLLVAALVGLVPEAVDRRGGAGAVLRAAALGLLGAGTLVHLDVTRRNMAHKTQQVGSGADAFRSDMRGRFVNDALEAYRQLARPGDTLAVLPEGVMINYLAQALNPTPYVNFMPPELLLFGEDEIVASFERAPPDWILLAHKDTSEYGFPLFGPDYGRRLATWVQENYSPTRQFGQRPLVPGTVFGLQLLRRR